MTEQAGFQRGALPARPLEGRSSTLGLLARVAQGSVGVAARTLAVTGITASSADVRQGDLFAALPGRTEHGARFAAEAARRGAVAVLTDRAGMDLLDVLGSELPGIEVARPRDVLGAVAAEVYGHPSRSVPLYGITGTSGKTTTTFLVRAGLTAAGRATGLIGTIGVFLADQMLKTQFTTPEAPELQALLAVMVERGVDVIGMEVSSHALRMGRADGIDFAVAGFTNLSQDHLDFHDDMEDYFAAKAALFDGRSRREVVVVDQPWGRRLVKPATVTVSGVGDADAAQWWAGDVVVAGDGSSRFTAHGPDATFQAGCRIPGEYNVANTLLALAILAELGVEPASVADAVSGAQVPGRMQRVDAGQSFLVVVDYSHKPAGVHGALEALRRLTPGRLLIVLGCGGDRDAGKRPVMGEVAARESDVLIVTDDNPRSEDPAAIRGAMLAGARMVPAEQSALVLEEGDRGAAIATAIGMARDGDTVLIAGKGHETGQQVGRVMLPFDDVLVAREALYSQGFREHGQAGVRSGSSSDRDRW